MYQFKKKLYTRNAIVYKEGSLSGKVYIVSSGEFQENCRILINDGLNDSDCLPLLTEREKKINMLQANFRKKPLLTTNFIRNIAVLTLFTINRYECHQKGSY